MSSLSSAKIKVTLIRSYIGKSESHRKTLSSLGLKRLGSSRVLPNLNPILGQVNKVIQFVRVEPVN